MPQGNKGFITGLEFHQAEENSVSRFHVLMTVQASISCIAFANEKFPAYEDRLSKNEAMLMQTCPCSDSLTANEGVWRNLSLLRPQPASRSNLSATDTLCHYPAQKVAAVHRWSYPDCVTRVRLIISCSTSPVPSYVAQFAIGKDENINTAQLPRWSLGTAGQTADQGF
jgi:hypothetical protein